MSFPVKKILKGKIFNFFGGIKPKELKNTSGVAIEELPIPSILCLPLEKHLGKDGIILVNVGEKVKKGQPLTRTNGKLVPLHAPTSGVVSSISNETLPHPSGEKGLCIVIKTDGFDSEYERKPLADFENADTEELIKKIHDNGVEGLGGAQYPTAAKLSSCLQYAKKCNVLIINGCECEPMVTCDDRLMQERALDIVTGIRILKKILNPKITIVAIEKNKPRAIESMKHALYNTDVAQVRELPVIYPTGSARNLIKAVTNLEIPYHEHTSECGIVVNNVGTVLAVKEAVVDGIPQISRVITVDGKSLLRQGNIRVRLGTSVRFILNTFALRPEYKQRVILGGPMMGFTLPSIDVPITKSASALLCPNSDEIPRHKTSSNCIRCGRCARVCPSRLVPYMLYSQSISHNHAACIKAGIKDCTLCGACSYICPSSITLTAQFRYEKAAERHIHEFEIRNAKAKERMKAKEERLLREEEERKKKKEAALERIKAQKEAESKMSPEEIASLRQKNIEEAKKKALAKKEELVRLKNSDANEDSDMVKVKKIKDIRKHAIDIAQHQGHLENDDSSINVVKILNLDSNYGYIKNDLLPKVLRRGENISKPVPQFEYAVKPEPYVKIDLLVGLEPDDKLVNPVQEKKIAAVLKSAEELNLNTKVPLPEILKKKLLRSKK